MQLKKLALSIIQFKELIPAIHTNQRVGPQASSKSMIWLQSLEEAEDTCNISALERLKMSEHLLNKCTRLPSTSAKSQSRGEAIPGRSLLSWLPWLQLTLYQPSSWRQNLDGNVMNLKFSLLEALTSRVGCEPGRRGRHKKDCMRSHQILNVNTHDSLQRGAFCRFRLSIDKRITNGVCFIVTFTHSVDGRHGEKKIKQFSTL